MNLNNKIPLPNKQILVCKWINDNGDYYRDFDEINSNEYKSCYYDSWEYINNEIKE